MFYVSYRSMEAQIQLMKNTEGKYQKRSEYNQISLFKNETRNNNSHWNGRAFVLKDPVTQQKQNMIKNENSGTRIMYFILNNYFLTARKSSLVSCASKTHRTAKG